MDSRIRHGVLIRAGLAALGLAGFSATAFEARRSTQSDSLPTGVTRAMLDRGKKLFHGAGLCVACHGLNGKGGIGPNLTDSTWIHHDGSYEALVRQILAGIGKDVSKSGEIMPPRGGSGLNEKDIRAIAGYVWSLSRKLP
jgi:mono/diheme cytochrome c family protein